MKKNLTVEIDLPPDGKVREVSPGCFEGGLPAPDIGSKLGFSVYRTRLDENDIWNPIDGEGPLAEGLQVNITGTSEGYRRLALYFLALAELDTNEDPGFHKHHDDLMSVDGATHIDFIIRKSDN